MDKLKKFQTLEDDILLLQQAGKDTKLSIGEIVRILSGKGRPLVLLVLSLPFCQPLQIPGLAIPFGLVIALIGLRMTFGKAMWLPRQLLSKKIDPLTLRKITDKALVLIKKIRPWIHPRWNGICHSRIVEKINGLTIFMLGIFLALPIPMILSNLVAAWSIFLLALGILEDDGVLLLIGYLASLLTVIFFSLIAITVKNFF